MPLPITKVNQNPEENKLAQDFSSLLPFLQDSYSLLSKLVYGDDEKKQLKDLWLQSKTREDQSLIVAEGSNPDKIRVLSSRGLVKIKEESPMIIELTKEGKKLLNQTILSEEKSAFTFTKQASKEIICKNSYDFGTEVLVKVKDKDLFGSKFITIKKSAFNKKAEPQVISEYNISTKKKDNENKTISDYSERELIEILHLAKTILDNKSRVVMAQKEIKSLPIHRIHAFVEMVMEELNKR